MVAVELHKLLRRARPARVVRTANCGGVGLTAPSVLSRIRFIMTEIKVVRRTTRGRRTPRTPNPEVPRRFLEAAAELIQERGFPAIRIEEVAERAGLAVGTFYLYFESKEDLFVQAVIEYTERLRGRLQAAYASEGTVRERLARALVAYLDFVEEHERGFLYYRDFSIETSVGHLSTWALDRHAEDLRPLLEEGMARGELPRGDPELMAQTLLAATQHIAGFWLQHKDRYEREQIQEFLSRSMFDS